MHRKGYNHKVITKKSKENYFLTLSLHALKAISKSQKQ